MPKKSYIPITALVAGMIGGIIRALELSGAYDDRQLVIAGSLLPAAMALYTVIAAAALIVLALRGTKNGGGFTALPQRSAGALNAYDVVSIICGAGLVVCGVYYFLTVERIVIDMLFTLFMVLTGVSVTALSFISQDDGSAPTRALLSAIPPLFGCLWLIILYRAYAGHPTLSVYCYQFLAVVLSTMSYYYMAGYHNRRGKLSKALVFSLLGVILCVIGAVSENGIMRYILILHAAIDLLAAFRLLSAAQNAAPSAEPEGDIQ